MIFLRKRKKKIFSNKHIIQISPSLEILEQYRKIRANIQFNSPNDKTLVVTSANCKEGRSTIVINLGISFAKSGKSVLLVDADMCNPTLHKKINLLNNNTGLSTLLSTSSNLLMTVKSTVVDNLKILPSGPFSQKVSELFDSQKMNQVIEEAKNFYDVVIFDVPPILKSIDAQIISSKVDGTILVISENCTDKKQAIEGKQLLEESKGNIIGAIYNKIG